MSVPDTPLHAARLLACSGSHELIPGSIHHEYDFPWGIGAVPSKIMQTAPMPLGEIVFIMNTTPDESSPRSLTGPAMPEGTLNSARLVITRPWRERSWGFRGWSLGMRI